MLSFRTLLQLEEYDEELISHLKCDPIEKVKKMSKEEMKTLLGRIDYLFVPPVDADAKKLIKTPCQFSLARESGEKGYYDYNPVYSPHSNRFLVNTYQELLGTYSKIVGNKASKKYAHPHSCLDGFLVRKSYEFGK